MRIGYPTGMLTNLARAFHQPDQTANNMKTQAYVMSAAANRDRDLAAAEEYKAKTAEREARNQARTPEAMRAAALAGMGMSPQAPQAMDLAEAFTTGRNPVTPGQPAVELPAFDNSQLGNFDLASVMGNPNISLETLAPAVQPVERPVDPAQLSDLAQRMSDLMGMQAATGDTNYHQLQQGAGQRMENDVLARVMRGEKVSPEELAAIKASALYDGSGGRYTGEDSEFTRNLESGRMNRNRDDNATRRYGTDVGARTSRANNADTIAGANLRHTTPGADKPKATDNPYNLSKDELAKLNAIRPAVAMNNLMPSPGMAESEMYLKLVNKLTQARRAGDMEAARLILYIGQRDGLIESPEE